MKYKFITSTYNIKNLLNEFRFAFNKNVQLLFFFLNFILKLRSQPVREWCADKV